MEKYRQFADGGTGVNPFVPTWSHHKAPLPTRLAKAVFCTPVALLRLVLLLVPLLWLALAEAVCVLIPVGMLRYPLYQLLVRFGCALALLVLGVFPSGDDLADYRRLKLAPPKGASGKAFDASRGTLVFVNQQGLTDVLFLALRLCPTFFFVAADGTPVEYGLLGALQRAGALAPPPPPAKPSSLAEIAERARSSWRGPVVVFAEGANTVGNCVLSWKAKTFEGTESLERPVGIALAGVQYSRTGAYTPHHTVGFATRHLFWLAFQPYHTVRALWLPAGEACAAVRGKPLAEQWAYSRTVLARMIKDAVDVEVPAERHADFTRFWDAAQRKGYTKPPASAPAKKRA